MDDDSLLKALKKGRPQNEEPIGHSPSMASSGDIFGNSDVAGNEFDLSPNKIAIEEVIQSPKRQLPRIKEVAVTQGINLSKKQKNNICTFAYALDVQLKQAIEAPRIHDAWPIESDDDSDELELNQAGPRPSLNAIAMFLNTEEFRELMLQRGVTVGASVGKLLPEQILLISILTDTSSKASIQTRLKRAGITWPVYNGWRRQKMFAQALQEAAGGVLTDAIENSDVQLAQLAQNGDLNAIKYLNEMVGRSPNDSKAVDAMQFAKVILDVVQRVVNESQAREIATLISIESKKIGLG